MEGAGQDLEAKGAVSLHTEPDNLLFCPKSNLKKNGNNRIEITLVILIFSSHAFVSVTELSPEGIVESR